MELQKQVVSLELARRLKELGVKQKSFFAWSEVARSSGKNWEIIWPGVDEWEGSSFDSWVTSTSAFTVAELGEMLPDHFDKGLQYDLSCWKEEDGWRIHYGRIGQMYYQIESSTEADARAKMLIYLLEKGPLK